MRNNITETAKYDRVDDLTDQLKPAAEPGQRLSLSREQPSPTDPALDDAEAQMRRALGLFGDQPRSRPDADRSDSPPRSGGGFGQNGFQTGGFGQGAHRRRFVQDGEIPVTVVRRDAPEAQGNGQGPSTTRLQRTEAALAAETAARDRAERALHETQAALQALQTKIGHNELAKNEAVAVSKNLRDELVTLRDEVADGGADRKDYEQRLTGAEDELRFLRVDLAEERRARKLAERLLREATMEPDEAPDEVAILEPPKPRRGRPPIIREAPAPELDLEPVKWWLTPAKVATKRR